MSPPRKELLPAPQSPDRNQVIEALFLGGSANVDVKKGVCIVLVPSPN